VPVSDALLTAVAELRHACRQAGHPLHEPVHANDLWIAASAVHIGALLLTSDTGFVGVPGISLHR
jgi:predicted nucleic acid-binding protein